MELFIFVIILSFLVWCVCKKSDPYHNNIPEGYLLLDSACEADVYVTPDRKIFKIFYKNKKHPYQNSKNALLSLQGYSHIPKLYDYDDNNFSMTMEDCGERISLSNLPKNYKQQIHEIEDTLKCHNIGNCDIHPLNITVKNGILYVVDWGCTGSWKDHDKFDEKRFMARLQEQEKNQWKNKTNREHAKTREKVHQ